MLRSQSTLRHLALSVGVLLLAAGLRLWQIASLPPGLHYDEAFHLLRAQEIVRGEAFPIYITGNQGNEPLMAWLSAIALICLGPEPWAGRLISAWAGLVTVAATMRACREFFPQRFVSVFAGFALATLYCHVNLSRFGTQPMLAAAAAALTMAALGYGLRTQRVQGYVGAGAALALGLYSYVAFRLFPVAPLAGGFIAWAVLPQARRSITRGSCLALLTAGLLYLPLGLFFLQHPEWFLTRFTQTTVSGGQVSSEVLSNFGKVVGGLFLEGDLNWRQNLPGRPAFDPIQAAIFVLGSGLALTRLRRVETGMVLVWLVVGLLPSVLTTFPPQFIRMSFVTPALASLMGLGWEGMWQWSQRWPPGRFVIIGALSVSGLWTTYDYFVRWANAPQLFIAWDVGLQAIARELRASPPEAELFQTPVGRDWPTLEFTLGREAFQRFKTFNGRECLVVPAETVGPLTYAVITFEDQFTLPRLKQVFPAGSETRRIKNQEADYAVFYDIPAGQTAALSLSESRAVPVSDELLWRGYELGSASLQPGEVIQLTMAWQKLKLNSREYKAFVHLHGPARSDGSIIYAQRDSAPCDNSYPTAQWQPGEVVIEHYHLQIPADTPSGEYVLRAGWYDAFTQTRLPIPDATAAPSGDLLDIQSLQVRSP